MSQKNGNSKWLHTAISWGASIVIIGVLFKILHIGGSAANYMIGVGLGVEAFLFFLMGLFPGKKPLDWTRVFPQLNENFEGTIPLSPIQNNSSNDNKPSSAMAFDKMLQDADIQPELLNKLGQNLTLFNANIESLASVSNLSEISNNVAKTLNHTLSKLDNMNLALDKAAENIHSIIHAPNYKGDFELLSNNIQKLNSIYSSELESTINHNVAIEQFQSLLLTKIKNISDSTSETEDITNEMTVLAKNLKQLNLMYANMLNAMNTRN